MCADWSIVSFVRFLTACLVLTAAQTAVADSVGTTTIGGDERRLPSYLIEVPDSINDILVADADSASLIRFSRSDAGIIERDSRYMSVGLNGVGKKRAWDKTTPLGVYFITEELDASKLADKYGIAAFVLDYPNAWDVYNERTGYGIWLHGVDPADPERPRRDTDGCVALPNDELLALADTLVPNVTPLIIAREMSWSSAADIEALRLEFRAALDIWRRSLESGDLYTYLGLYDETFSSRGMGKADWATYRMGALRARPLDAVELDEVLLVRDPEVPDLYLSRFTQTLRSADGDLTTRKRLYWRRNGSDWRIVSEDAG